MVYTNPKHACRSFIVLLFVEVIIIYGIYTFSKKKVWYIFLFAFCDYSMDYIVNA